MASTYVLEIPSVLAMDWVSRHDRFYELQYRTQQAVAARLSPCQLLQGKCSGIKAKPKSVIKLHDKRRHRQMRLCEMFHRDCRCHPR